MESHAESQKEIWHCPDDQHDTLDVTLKLVTVFLLRLHTNQCMSCAFDTGSAAGKHLLHAFVDHNCRS